MIKNTFVTWTWNRKLIPEVSVYKNWSKLPPHSLYSHKARYKDIVTRNLVISQKRVKKATGILKFLVTLQAVPHVRNQMLTIRGTYELNRREHPGKWHQALEIVQKASYVTKRKKAFRLTGDVTILVLLLCKRSLFLLNQSWNASVWVWSASGSHLNYEFL